MAKRVIRRERTKAAPAVTAEDRIRVMTQKLRAIQEDHQASGGTGGEWAEALRRLAETPGTDSLTSPNLAMLDRFATLLEAWHSNPRWLDDGRPRPLAPRGAKGFPGLCRSIGDGSSAEALADHGLAVGILATNANGDLVPTDRSALVSKPSPMLLEMMSAGMAAWQATIRHNVHPDTPPEARRLDRGIHHQALARRLVPEYHRMVRREFAPVVNNVDNWLQAHRPGPDERDVAFVCVHVFAGTEEARPARRRKSR